MRVMKYVDVIIPLRFRDSVTYSVPQELEGRIVPGSIVKVTVVGRSYTAVVLRVKDVPGRQVASYYMCSLGEAFRFAAPSTVKALKRDKARDADVEEATGNVSGGPEPAGVALPVLSEEQAQAVDSIRNLFSSGNNVLLHGVTGYTSLWRMNVSEKGGVSCILFRRSPSAVRYRSGLRTIFRAGCWYIIPGRPLRTRGKYMRGLPHVQNVLSRM